MKHIVYKKISLAESIRISEIDASQYIKHAWRVVNDKRELVELNYQSDGYPEGFDHHHEALRQTLIKDGFAIGAYHQDQLIGFASLNKDIFGSQYKHVLLDQMFISKAFRNQGIGKKLMSFCIEQAKIWQVDKIYICAGSSEDTIAFYKKLGCIEAIEINQKLYEDDPRDIQLEFDITK